MTGQAAAPWSIEAGLIEAAGIVEQAGPDNEAQGFTVLYLSTGAAVFCWVELVRDGIVSLTEARRTLDRMLKPKVERADYMLHLRVDHVIAWRYADLEQVVS